jgi:propanediol utilization protein
MISSQFKVNSHNILEVELIVQIRDKIASCVIRGNDDFVANLHIYFDPQNVVRIYFKLRWDMFG